MSIRIYTISRPCFDYGSVTEFLENHNTEWKRSKETNNAEEIIEFAARVCYLSFGNKQSSKKTALFLRDLIHHGHESVLEHANWSFIVEGVSRAFTHQLVRHRVGFSFSQLSQQYHDESDATFIEPPEIKQDHQAHAIWKEAVEKSHSAYKKILQLLQKTPTKHCAAEHIRAVRSATRSVLPNATRSTIFITANARAIRYLLRIRGAIAGDYEMREFSAQLLQQVKADAPSLFFDFESGEGADGTPYVHWTGIDSDK